MSIHAYTFHFQVRVQKLIITAFTEGAEEAGRKADKTACLPNVVYVVDRLRRILKTPRLFRVGQMAWH